MAISETLFHEGTIGFYGTGISSVLSESALLRGGLAADHNENSGEYTFPTFTTDPQLLLHFTKISKLRFHPVRDPNLDLRVGFDAEGFDWPKPGVAVQLAKAYAFDQEDAFSLREHRLATRNMGVILVLKPTLFDDFDVRPEMVDDLRKNIRGAITKHPSSHFYSSQPMNLRFDRYASALLFARQPEKDHFNQLLLAIKMKVEKSIEDEIEDNESDPNFQALTFYTTQPRKFLGWVSSDIEFRELYKAMSAEWKKKFAETTPETWARVLELMGPLEEPEAGK